MNKNQYETFETLGGTKKSSKYRCENCGFNKPIGENGTYCSKAAEISVIFNPEEDSNMFLGCASHSDFQNQRERVLDELEKRNTECIERAIIDQRQGALGSTLRISIHKQVIGWIEELREGK